VDSVAFLHDAIAKGKKFLIESANATMLDIDYGTYPYVTSSSPVVGGACTGLGVAPSQIGQIVGVIKAYTTRVGEGPFPTECQDKIGDTMRSVGKEFGVTTGRPRRCGWIDITQLRYTQQLNGMTDVALTKLDVLSGFEEIKLGTKYFLDGKEVTSVPAHVNDLARVKVEYLTVPGWKEDISKVTTWDELPENAKRYIELIERLIEVPIVWIGVGPGREAIVERRPWWRKHAHF